MVQTCFCEALELELEEVTFESRVLTDLGAESLDLLDVVFRLERTFDIQIPRDGVIGPNNGQAGGNEQNKGVLTEEDVQRLHEIMPEVPPNELYTGMKFSEVPTVFRVGTFYHLIVTLLQQEASDR